MSDAPLEEQLQRRVENSVLWITLNRPDAGNAITPDVRNRMIDLPRRGQRVPRVRAVVLTAAGDEALLHRRRPAAPSGDGPAPKPEGAPERIVGDAARMIRTGMPAPDQRDPRLREAGDRRAQRHRRRRRHAPSRSRATWSSRPRTPGSSRCSCAAASSPTAAAPTCSPASSACRRRRSWCSSATTSRRPRPSASASSTRSCPRAELEATRQRVGRAAGRRARPRPSAFAKWLTQPLARRRPRAPRSADEACASGAREPHRGLRAKASPASSSAARPSSRAGSTPCEPLLQGPDRDRRHRPDRVRQGPARHRALARVPGDLGRARRRRHRSRPRSTGSRCSRWRTGARSTSPATSASATSRSSARSATAAARAAASSGTRRWRWPPGSARSRSRGGPASAPPRRAVRGRRSARGSPGTGSGAGRSGLLRPVDEIAMLTRRYMHEFGAHARPPRQRRARVPQARQPQPGGDDVRRRR